jgi:hypothetical protein
MAQQIIIKGTPVVAANEVLVADSNSKIPAVDGSLVTAMAGGNIAGTVPTARLDTGTTANKLVVLGASGLPAVDGSLLTGIVSHTTSASDPTLSTNPSGGVGSEWINSTSGKQFILTDATAGANVWTCSGGRSGDVTPWYYGGTQYGYQTGGYPNTDVIHKFSFTSDGNATDIGNLTIARHALTGQSGDSYGYSCGGKPDPDKDRIDKFSFTTDGDATDVGNMSVARSYSAGNSYSTHGYCSGGDDGDASPTTVNIIDKFPFASDTNSVDVGNLSTAKGAGFAQSSTTHGYCTTDAVMDKFSFTSDGNATDVGALSVSRSNGAGQSSGTYGYSSGGTSNGDVIDKFAFAADGTATDVGNLTVARGRSSGQSSRTYGYVAGGTPGGNVIDKFSFTSDGNAADVGDLTATRQYCTGQHY